MGTQHPTGRRCSSSGYIHKRWPGDLDGRLPGFAESKTLAEDINLEGHPSAIFELDGLMKERSRSGG